MHFRILHIHTCYYSSMIFSTCDVTYFMPPQVLHRLWYRSFKNKSTMSQLPMLSKSKSIDICLWKCTSKVNNKEALYVVPAFQMTLPSKKKTLLKPQKTQFFFQLPHLPTNQLHLSTNNRMQQQPPNKTPPNPQTEKQKQTRKWSTKLSTENKFQCSICNTFF